MDLPVALLTDLQVDPLRTTFLVVNSMVPKNLCSGSGASGC